MDNYSITIITQARVGSSRLPAKVLMEVTGKSLLQIHLERIQRSKLADEVIVATTQEKGADVIVKIAAKLGISSYQGSTEDVLDRFYRTVANHPPDYIVRLTSDCPLIDPQVIDSVIKYTVENELDYCSNTLKETFPDGQDVEVLTFNALEKAWKEAKLPSEREHVTPYIRENSNLRGGTVFKAGCVESSKNLGHVRMTVDEQADFDMVKELIEKYGTEQDWVTYATHIDQHIEHFSNQGILRNEGYLKSIQKDNKS